MNLTHMQSLLKRCTDEERSMYVIFFALNVIITAISSTFILYGKASSSLNFEGRFFAVPTILSAMSGAFFIVHCEASGYSMLWAYGVTVSHISAHGHPNRVPSDVSQVGEGQWIFCE